MPANEFEVFIQDSKDAIGAFLDDNLNKRDFKAIYRKGMYASHILKIWAVNSQELLEAAAGVAKRVIALFSIRQYSLVNVELRRFIECILWFTYFIDHPVEFEQFKGQPFRSWRDKPKKPIETAASSSIHFYLQYLEERLAYEPSGLAQKAVDILQNEYDTLSTYIHGARPAMDGTLSLTYDQEDKNQNRQIRQRTHKILKSGCIIVAALKSEWLDELSPKDRIYFDKLVSPSTAKKIKENIFGLQ